MHDGITEEELKQLEMEKKGKKLLVFVIILVVFAVASIFICERIAKKDLEELRMTIGTDEELYENLYFQKLCKDDVIGISVFRDKETNVMYQYVSEVDKNGTTLEMLNADGTIRIYDKNTPNKNLFKLISKKFYDKNGMQCYQYTYYDTQEKVVYLTTVKIGAIDSADTIVLKNADGTPKLYKENK